MIPSAVWSDARLFTPWVQAAAYPSWQPLLIVQGERSGGAGVTKRRPSLFQQAVDLLASTNVDSRSYGLRTHSRTNSDWQPTTEEFHHFCVAQVSWHCSFQSVCKWILLVERWKRDMFSSPDANVVSIVVFFKMKDKIFDMDSLPCSNFFFFCLFMFSKLINITQ